MTRQEAYNNYIQDFKDEESKVFAGAAFLEGFDYGKSSAFYDVMRWIHTVLSPLGYDTKSLETSYKQFINDKTRSI